MSSSKERIMKKMGSAKVELNKFDKANHNAGFRVGIEKKEVDGKKVTSMTCYLDGPCCVEPYNGEPEPAPLKKEYTSKEEFIAYLSGVIDSIEKQI